MELLKDGNEVLVKLEYDIDANMSVGRLMSEIRSFEYDEIETGISVGAINDINPPEDNHYDDNEFNFSPIKNRYKMKSGESFWLVLKNSIEE